MNTHSGNVCHYLDNASTTATMKCAADAAYRCMTEIYGNPSSVHKIGLAANKLLSASRLEIAKAFGCSSGEIFFTSGGTESINTAIIGTALKKKARRRHIVSTTIEHHATLNTLRRLENAGFEITLVPPMRDGTITAESVLSAVRDDTSLVTVMSVNNETGAILPVEQIAAGLRSAYPNVIFHTDMVQSFLKTGRLPAQTGADIISVSGHKIGAPKGVGAIYIKSGLSINPLITGGGQENSFRSGTENLPSIAAFAQCCKIRRENALENHERVLSLNRRARETIAGKLPNVVFISREDFSPYILCLSLPKTKSEVVLRVLSDRGIYISNGSACAKGKRSHVLTEMRLPPDIIDGAIRISFCPENTNDDIDALADGLLQAGRMFNL